MNYKNQGNRSLMNLQETNFFNKEHGKNKSANEELGEVYNAHRNNGKINVGYEELRDDKLAKEEVRGAKLAYKDSDGECKQTERESNEICYWLVQQNSPDDELGEDSENHDKQKKEGVHSINNGKKSIELFEGRIMMLQFMKSLGDEDFCRFVSKLEEKFGIEEGFIKKMIEDLDVELPSISGDMENGRKKAVTEIKDEKQELEVLNEEEKNEEEKNSTDFEFKVVDETKKGAWKSKVPSDKSMSSKEKILEGKNFHENFEQETVSEKRGQSPKYDKINSELELLSSRKSMKDEEFEEIHEEQFTHELQNASSSNVLTDPYKPVYSPYKSYESLMVRMLRRFCPCTRLKLGVEQSNQVNGVRKREIDNQEDQVGEKKKEKRMEKISHEKQEERVNKATEEYRECQEEQVEKGNEGRVSLNQQNSNNEKSILMLKKGLKEDDNLNTEEDEFKGKTKLPEDEERISEQAIQKDEQPSSEKKKSKVEEETERTKRIVSRIRLLKIVLEKKVVTSGNLEKLVQVARDAGLPEEKVNHLTKRPVIPSLQKFEETLELGEPILDEVAEKFIITPRFKDQIVFRTDENQWEVLGENLKDENKKNTIERIKKEYEKVYDKSYAMLTILMEQYGRNDWLFIKSCYENVPGSSQIVREMEVIINQHIKDFDYVLGHSVTLCKNAFKATVGTPHHQDCK